MSYTYTTKDGQKVTTYYDDHSKNKQYVEKREQLVKEKMKKVPLSQKIGRAAGKVGAWVEERGRAVNEREEREEPPRRKRRARHSKAPSMSAAMGPAPGLSNDPFGVGNFGGFGREPRRKKRRGGNSGGFNTGIPPSMRWMF
jgi:hypothetical protein